MAKVRHSVLGEMKFLLGQTRSTWVMLYDQPPEKVYEDPRFMGIELKLRDVALTPKGKRMYVSRIDKRDLDQINAIASKDARVRTGADTLAPLEGAFSYDETMARLRRCTLIRSTAAGFDLSAFWDVVRFMTPTQGDGGNYYYLEAGDPNDPMTCELHILRDPLLPEAVYTHKAFLSFGKELSFLYLDITY